MDAAPTTQPANESKNKTAKLAAAAVMFLVAAALIIWNFSTPERTGVPEDAPANEPSTASNNTPPAQNPQSGQPPAVPETNTNDPKNPYKGPTPRRTAEEKK